MHHVPGRAVRAIPARLGTPLLVGLCLVLLAVGCSRDEAGSGPVSWPELVRFDDISYRAEGFLRAGDMDAVLDMRAELLESGRAVTPDTIPANVPDRPTVETILGDLSDLVEDLAADEEALRRLLPGVHPVVARLMRAAGMPHVHAMNGPNHGLLRPVFDMDGQQVGTAEIRLDAGTGVVHAWLNRGGHGGDPWMLPSDTTLVLDVPEQGRSVTLTAGEVGAGSDGEGGTHAFTSAGAAEADASWLASPDFAATVELRFRDATTGPFVLRPHAHDHGDGDGSSSAASRGDGGASGR